MSNDISYGLDGVTNFKLSGFATGSYVCTCECGEEYIGDKRSTHCLKCAIEFADKASKYYIETQVGPIEKPNNSCL